MAACSGEPKALRSNNMPPTARNRLRNISGCCPRRATLGRSAGLVDAEGLTYNVAAKAMAT